MIEDRDIHAMIDSEIEECEAAEAAHIAHLEEMRANEEAIAEQRESLDLAYDEWAKVATHTGVPHTYKKGA